MIEYKIFIIIVIAVTTLLMRYAVVKMFEYIKRPFRKLKQLAMDIETFGGRITLFNSEVVDLQKAIKPFEDFKNRLETVERVAHNFDSDMNRYNENLDKIIAKRFTEMRTTIEKISNKVNKHDSVI